MDLFLTLGFVIGLQHAFEADHLAAMGVMACDKPSGVRRLMMRGAFWGLGHSLMLFVVCTIAFVADIPVSDRVAASIEASVGLMLIVIGLDAIRRTVCGGTLPLMGSRKPVPVGAAMGVASASGHRAFGIGLLHGAAGSAALMALAASKAPSVGAAISYVLVFGMGSVVGMATLSALAGLPLGWLKTRGQSFMEWLAFAAGTVAIFVGLGLFVGGVGTVFG